jgi:hypothetical protein
VAVDKPDIRAAVGAAAGRNLREFERDELGPTCFGRPASSDWRAWSLEAQGPALSRGAVAPPDDFGSSP